MIDSGLVGSTEFSIHYFHREGFRESRRCSRDTYPESYVTEYILIHEKYCLYCPNSVRSVLAHGS